MNLDTTDALILTKTSSNPTSSPPRLFPNKSLTYTSKLTTEIKSINYLHTAEAKIMTVHKVKIKLKKQN